MIREIFYYSDDEELQELLELHDIPLAYEILPDGSKRRIIPSNFIKRSNVDNEPDDIDAYVREYGIGYSNYVLRIGDS